MKYIYKDKLNEIKGVSSVKINKGEMLTYSAAMHEVAKILKTDSKQLHLMPTNQLTKSAIICIIVKFGSIEYLYDRSSGVLINSEFVNFNHVY